MDTIGFISYVMVVTAFSLNFYYIAKMSLKKSIIGGLFAGIIFALPIPYQPDYLLIIRGIVFGIIVVLWRIAYGYLDKLTLKESIWDGLVWGIIAAIGVLVGVKSLDFLYNLLFK